MKNKIEDLRNHMFAQIENLMDPDKDLDTEIKRAKAVSGVGQVIINSAKAEVEFIKVVGGSSDTAFFKNKQLDLLQKSSANHITHSSI